MNDTQALFTLAIIKKTKKTTATNQVSPIESAKTTPLFNFEFVFL